MVGALTSGSSGPGLRPGHGNRVGFLHKTLKCHGAPLCPGL